MLDRERQPGALGGRQPADARGDARARAARRDRRGVQRERARGALRAAGVEPVREGRGDVLQPRVPAQRLPPAPSGDRAAPGHARRAGDPRAPGRSAGRADRRRLRSAARRRRRGAHGVRRRVPRGHGERTRASPSTRRSCSTARSVRHCPRASRPRPSTGPSRTSSCRRTPTPRRAPASTAIRSRPARSSSTRSSRAAPASSSPTRSTTRAGRASACPSIASTWRSPSCIGELEKLAAGPRPRDREFPFILSAGERRSDTTNTIIRNPASLAKERAGTLRISAADAGRLGFADGDLVRLRRGAAAPRCPSR